MKIPQQQKITSIGDFCQGELQSLVEGALLSPEMTELVQDCKCTRVSSFLQFRIVLKTGYSFWMYVVSGTKRALSNCKRMHMPKERRFVTGFLFNLSSGLDEIKRRVLTCVRRADDLARHLHNVLNSQESRRAKDRRRLSLEARRADKIKRGISEATPGLQCSFRFAA